MQIQFDISPEELPIFLAEADEHLQSLEDILLQLEGGSRDPDLLQSIFRSAHTIKGMSGMIGHTRMTELTHALETALDGLRKNSLPVSPALIRLCLQTVDTLRELRGEVESGQTCAAPAQENAQALLTFLQNPLAPPEEPNPPAPAFQNRNNGRRSADLTVRTNVERLNNLMNLVGELITDRNRLKRIHSRLTRLNSNYDQINETITHLGRITDQLQEEVMRIRMLPVSNVFAKFPRMVHDMAQKVNKSIDLALEGEETEIDRSIIEEINDPLIHLLRNAVDHGIEPPALRRAAGKPERGKIRLCARHEQGSILITVQDDGGGVNGEALKQQAIAKGLLSPEEAANLSPQQATDLMFLPGLSTSARVTDISGRGVGMDIVSANIQRVNGSIRVETRPGEGTAFHIILPLTLAIIPALLVRVEQTIYAIPLVMITETLRLDSADIQQLDQKPVTVLRNSVLPLASLAEIFGSPPARQTRQVYAVVVQTGKQRLGLMVDALLGEEEVIVKPLGALVGELAGISSAAILGDGQVALIVDVFGLFKRAGL
jgi:two-component system chemotaxis sensor kinase CheA